MGTKFAARAIEHLIMQAKQYVNVDTNERNAMDSDSATLLGLRGRHVSGGCAVGHLNTTL